MAISRRQFLKGAAIAGVGFALPALPFKRMVRRSCAFSQSPIIMKFQNPLPGLGPNGIPLATKFTRTFAEQFTDVYHLGVTKFSQQIDPALPNPTHFLGYQDLASGSSRYLGGVIVAKRGTPVLLNITNNLLDEAIVPIDPTIMMGMGKTVGDYPFNRIATHGHGGFVPWFSDGTPHQWFTPGGPNYQAGPSFMNVPGTNPPQGTGTYYYPIDQSARLVWYHDHAIGITRTNAYCGIASAFIITDDFEAYLIGQRFLPDLGTPLIIQDKTFFDPANDPNYPIAGAKKGDLWYPWDYEKNSLPNGHGRWDYGPDMVPPAVGTMPLPPISAVPEFFSDTILVNGGAYPVMHAAPKRVRFRILNGSQARFYHLNLYYEDPNNPGEVPIKGFDANGKPILNVIPGPFMYQIGTEGGFLPKVAVLKNTTPVPLDPTDPTGNSADPDGPFNLLLAPAERADIIIDFNGVPANTKFILYSDAPAPFPGGDPRNDYYTGDPDFSATGFNQGGAPTTLPGQGPNTRTLLRIIVDAGSGDSMPTSTWLADMDLELAYNFMLGNQPPLLFSKPGQPWIPQFPFTGHVDRMLTLNEDFDDFGRLIQGIGTTTSLSTNNQGLNDWGLSYNADATETPKVGATEVWQVYNLTGDTHPIHWHLVNVQTIQRQKFTGDPAVGFALVGPPMPPDANESGWKDTVRMNPGEVTTVIMKFDLPFLPSPEMRAARSPRTGGWEYVWHCHILEHEEHDMMRPLVLT
jgi:spore coat protein A, manganese oxidase